MRKLAVVLIGWLFAMSVKAADHCVILQYHHVSESTPGITSVTPDQFQQHLDYLKNNNYRVMALETVIRAMQQNQALPDKCIALTIDDAFKSIYKEAWPRARNYDFPLTVFVSTESVDQGLKAYVTWDQIREMSKAGVSFQNHSHSHDHLIRRDKDESKEDWEQRIASEILIAQNRIQEEVGINPTLFAYPYGEYTTELKEIIRSIGLVGFGQQSGPIWKDGDFAALPRFPMASVYASMKTFPTKVASLPLPVESISPGEPVVELDEWSPTVTLKFKPKSYKRHLLTCFANGSPAVEYVWPEDQSDTVEVTTKGKLNIGRNRYNCTMPSKQNGRFHWYSHNWIRRKADGSWYREAGL